MEKPKNTSMQEKQKMAIAIGGGGGVVGVLVWGGVVAIGTLVAVAAIKLRNKKLSDNGNHHPQPPPIPSTTDASSKLDLNNHVNDYQEKGLRILLQDGSAPPADYLPSGDGIKDMSPTQIDSTPLNSNKSLISDIDTMLDITGQIEKKPTYSNILLGDNPKPKTSSLLTDYGVNNQENGEKIVEVKEEIETAQKDKVAVEEKLKVMKEVEAIRAPNLPQIEVELPETKLIVKGGGGGGEEEEEEGDGDDDAGAMKVVIETNQKGQFAVEFELEQIKVMKEDEATGWVGLGENVFADATMNHTRSKHSAVDGYSPNPQKRLAENEEEGEWDEQENGETIVERVEEVVETTQKDQFVVGLHTLAEKAIDSTPLNSNKSLISDIDTMLDITGQIEKKPTYLNILLGDNPKPKTSSLLTDYGVNNQENGEKIVEVKEEIETAQKDKVAVEEKLKVMKEVEAIRAPDLPQIEVELPEMQLIAKRGGGGGEEEEEEGDGDDDAGAMKVVIETNQKGQFAVEFELEQIKVMKEDEAIGWVGLGENVFADATMNHTKSKHSAVDGYSPNPQKRLAENEEEGEWDEQENGETIVERVEEVVETTQKDQFVVGLHTLGEKAIDSTPLNSNKSLISDIDTMLDITGQIEKKPTYLNILLGDNPKPKTSSLLTDYGVNNKENGEKIVEVKEEIETAQKDKVAVEEKLKAMKEVEAIRAPDLPQIEVELPEMQLIAKGGGGGGEEEEEEGDGDDDAGAMKVVIETNQKGQFAVEFEVEQIKVMKEDEATGWVGLGENVFADATMNHTKSKHSAVDGYSPNPQKRLAENEEEGEWDEHENGETIVERVEEVVETTQKDQFVVGLHTLGEKAIDSIQIEAEDSPRMEPIGKGGEEDGDNIAEIVEQVIEAAQKNQFAVEMDREVIQIMKEDEKLDSTQIKAEDREHDDGEKDEPAGIEEEDEVDDNEEDEEIAEKGEGSSEVTGDSSMEINAEAEEKEHDDGKIKHNPLVILVQEEEDSDEVDDDNEDEEITEIGEGSSEGTGDSSMESNAGAIWPAESIEELSLEFKEYKINNQKLEETTDRYIVSEESGFCGSYANGCRENEDTARSRITHVKELLRKKINVPMELSGIGIWIWSVAVLLVVVAPLLLSLASIVKL